MTVICADAREALPRLGYRVADSIVTSPPYADVREDVESVGPDEFVEWLLPFLDEMAAVLKLNGSLMLNLGRKFAGGVESSYAERVLLAAEARGWLRIDTVVWAKINGRPINPYLTNAHETVYWLTPGPRPLDVYRGFDDVRYPYAPETLLRYQRRWTNHANRKDSNDPRDEAVQEGRVAHELGSRPRSVYVTQVGKEKGIEHPTPMALDLARFLVCLSCPPGGLVVDPFFGAGTTGVAANLHGRRFAGIELDSVFAAEAERRLAAEPPREVLFG